MRVFKKKGGTARRDIDVILAEMDKVCVLGVFWALNPGGLTFTLNIIMLFFILHVINCGKKLFANTMIHKYYTIYKYDLLSTNTKFYDLYKYMYFCKCL